MTIIIKPSCDYQVIQEGDKVFLYEINSGAAVLVAGWNKKEKISFAELMCDPVDADNLSFSSDIISGKNLLMEIYYGGGVI
jgi:hypothetical protein